MRAFCLPAQELQLTFLEPQISIRLPVAEYTNAQLAARPGTPAPGSSIQADDRCETWEMWNTIRTLCGYSPRLTLSKLGECCRMPASYSINSCCAALDLTNPLPPAPSLGRWSAEPVKHLFLPCTSFIPNAKGYPVLSKSMQAFLKGIFKVSCANGPFESTA